MKRFITMSVTLLLLGVVNALAANPFFPGFQQTVANEPGLTYSNTYQSSDLNAETVATLSMQTIQSSVTYSAASFTDGTTSTGSIVVSSYTALHGLPGTNTLTVVSGKNPALAAAKATDTLTVVTNSTDALNGSSFNLNGKTFRFSQDYFFGTSTQNTALSMANAVNANTNFSASATNGVVTITCATTGISCNKYTLTSSTPAAVSVGSAKFTGGQDAVNFNLNGRILTNGTDWFTGASSTNTAASIVTAATGSGFTATASSNVVTVSCASSGTFCNAYTLTTSSSAALLAGAAKFSGGVNNAVLSIKGIPLTEGKDFTAATSSATTAVNIANAINGNSALSAIVAASTGPIGVVTTTSTAVGSSVNYSIWSSSQTALVPFASAMRGGTASAVLTASGALNVTKHGFTTALPVLFKVTTGTGPQDLVANATYYVVYVDANDFKLATTSAKAKAGTADVRLSTQTTTGGGSFSLSPLAISGTPSWKWQYSNDGTNWNDLTTTSGGVAVSSVTFSSPYNDASSAWDLGSINFQYIRLNVVGPTQGGIKLKAVINGRRL
jgi:hypothetical protein